MTKTERILDALESKAVAINRTIAKQKNREIIAIYENERTAIRALITEINTGQLDLETVKPRTK